MSDAEDFLLKRLVEGAYDRYPTYHGADETYLRELGVWFDLQGHRPIMDRLYRIADRSADISRAMDYLG